MNQKNFNETCSDYNIRSTKHLCYYINFEIQLCEVVENSLVVKFAIRN